MKMTNQELAAHIEVLRAEAQEALNAWGMAGLKVTAEMMLSNEITPETIAADKAKSAYDKACDKVRHAEGWLEQRQFLAPRVERKEEAPKRQVIGDLIRKQLAMGA